MSTLTASTRRMRSNSFHSPPPSSSSFSFIIFIHFIHFISIQPVARFAFLAQRQDLLAAAVASSDQHMVFGAESALGFGVRDAPPLASVLRSSSLGGTYRVPSSSPFFARGLTQLR